MKPADDQTIDSPAAFKQFYLNQVGTLRNYLYYLTGDLELAKDLTQESFTKLWIKRKGVLSSKAAALLFTIGKNLVIDLKRRDKVKLTFQRRTRISGQAEDPGFLLEAKEFGKQLEDSISSLPEKQREVFLLNRMDKKSYQEIAQLLGVSIKTVEKRMSQALQVMRKIHKKI